MPLYLRSRNIRGVIPWPSLYENLKAHAHTDIYIYICVCVCVCNEIFTELERVLQEAVVICVLASRDRGKLRKTSDRISAFQAEK